MPPKNCLGISLSGNADKKLDSPKEQPIPSVKANVRVPARPADNAMQSQIAAQLSSAAYGRAPGFASFETFGAAPASASAAQSTTSEALGGEEKKTTALTPEAPAAKQWDHPKTAIDTDVAADQNREKVMVVEDEQKAKVERYLKRMRKQPDEKLSQKDKAKEKQKAKEQTPGPEEPKDIKKAKKKHKKMEKAEKKQEKARKKQLDRERALVAAERANKRIFGYDALSVGSSSESGVQELDA